MSKSKKIEERDTMLNEDRKFQLEMLKIQLRHETTTAIYLGAIALGYSLMVTLLPLLWFREVLDIQKIVIFLGIIIMGTTLFSLLARYVKSVRKLDADIGELEKKYIETKKEGN